MEARWDPNYSGTNGSCYWALYDLSYVRLNGITVAANHEVRFTVACKAVIRRIICHGGLNKDYCTHHKRIECLSALEAIDRVAARVSAELLGGEDVPMGDRRSCVEAPEVRK